MKILVAGAQGQLARALVEAGQSHAGVAVTALGRPDLDLRDGASIARALNALAPHIVINAAAYTAVDAAEADIDAAFAVNRDGAARLAAAARTRRCPIMHVSTDYVFDGQKEGAYTEDDAPHPVSVYGRSKLDGERAVGAANPEHLIVRTAWVFSPHGHNFLKTMLRLAKQRAELRVVGDQRGNPTYAAHLAEAMLAMALKVHAAAGSQPAWGVFHAVAQGETTWAGLAAAILAAAPRLGVPQLPVIPITTAQFPTPAKRPANSCLSCGKLERVFGLRLPAWQEGVAACMTRLAASPQ
jgi:dTDP-4-dehydrorhamnose reductase